MELVSERSRAKAFDKSKGFQQWCEAEFTSELLPIAPPDATIAPGSSIRPEHLGKVPAVRNADGTWNGLAGQWSKDFHATLDDCKRWHHWGANVGLQTRLFPAIDIDAEDPQLAAELERAAIERLGPAPVRFRAGSSHRLLLYRCDPAEPFRKLRLAGTKEGRTYAVELLGLGQQTVGGGKHKSGADIEWRSSPFTALHALDRAAVESLFHV
jgi:hypothetical protein